MKKQRHDTRWMVSVALMAAIVIVLANTPLGMIQLPIIKATTVHIPVIIGAVLLGPSAGAILGAVFGICSLISNTMAPTLLSFAFSPFMSTSGIPGALQDPDRGGGRMAVDPFHQIEGESDHRPSNRWVRRLHGQHHHSHGKYLPALCAAVCRSQRSGCNRRMGAGNGNRDRIRYPGSNCRGDIGAGSWKGPDQCI